MGGFLRFLSGMVWIGMLLGVFASTEALFPGAPPGNETAADDQKLETVLATMDRAAPRFSSMVGRLDYTKATVVVDDHSTESGEIYFEKSKDQPRVMIAFRQPAEKYVLFADDKVSLYRPKIAVVEEYFLSQRQDLLEQFLLLGFGTAGKELRKAYRISLLGEEHLDGQQVFRLELIPKSPKVSAQLQRIELWISPQTWQPLQQKFFEASGDYLIARYSDLKVNVKIPGKNFRLPLKGKVRTIRPQNPD